MKFLYPIFLMTILFGMFYFSSYLVKDEVNRRTTLLPKIKYERHLIDHRIKGIKIKTIELEK